MTAVRIRFFARARDLAGCDTLDLIVEPGTTVAGLRALLAERIAALAPLLPRCAVAVDRQFAEDNAPLTEGVEVAILPPVSGG